MQLSTLILTTWRLQNTVRSWNYAPIGKLSSHMALSKTTFLELIPFFFKYRHQHWESISDYVSDLCCLVIDSYFPVCVNASYIYPELFATQDLNTLPNSPNVLKQKSETIWIIFALNRCGTVFTTHATSCKSLQLSYDLSMWQVNLLEMMKETPKSPPLEPKTWLQLTSLQPIFL